MKINKKIVIVFTILLSFCFVMSVKAAASLSVSEVETTYRGTTVKISSSSKISSLKIYQKDDKGNWAKFFEDDEVNATEKSYFISMYRLSTTDKTKLKAIAVLEDGTEIASEKEISKIPEAPTPSQIPSSSPSSSSSTSPSTSPSSSSSTSPSTTPTSSSSTSPTSTTSPSPSEVTVKSIAIKNEITLQVGDTYTLKPTITPSNAKTTLTWSTNNKKSATVDGNGKVTAVKTGTATITVKTANGRTATCKVKIVGRSVTLNGHKVTFPENTNDRVYFLDVADYSSEKGKVQGSDAIVIESDGKYAMIDVGVKSKGNRVVRYLKDIGVEKLEWILITHAHQDHYGALNKVLKNFEVGGVYAKDISAGKSDNIKQYKKNIKKVAEDNGVSLYNVSESANKKLKVGEIELTLYNTQDRLKKKSSSRGENVNSVTALAKINGQKVYFAADIVNDTDVNINAETVAAKAADKCSVYKVAHHSYSPNNSVEALKILNPKEGIVTNQLNRSGTGDARTRILENTRINSKNLRYTASGTVILTIDESGVHDYKKLAEDK